MDLISRVKTLQPASRACVDTAMVAALLVAANALLDPGDMGWVRLQPSPYLMLPVLIGSRYGFRWGLGAGGLAAAVAVAGSGGAGWGPAARAAWTDFARTEAYPLVALIVAGGVCGEIQRQMHRRQLQLKVESEDLRGRLRTLDADLGLLRETKAELERLVATRDSDISTLDADLRRLFEAEADDLPQGLLLLLHRQTRLADAAVYRLQANGLLKRLGALGSTKHLPESLARDEIEMVELALRRGAPVTVPEFWQREGEADRIYLMAVPLLDAVERPLGVVLVTGMPLLALNRKAVRLAALICRWAGRIFELRGDDAVGTFRVVRGLDTQRLFAPDYFRRTLALAHDAQRLHDLPSSVAVFRLAGRSVEARLALERRVMAQVRTGDFAGELGLDTAHLAVLLPLTGERGAHIFVERVLGFGRQDPALSQGLEGRAWPMAGATAPSELWDELKRYGAHDASAA
jgi:hypothetical protein